MEWYLKAAKQGNAHAMNNIGDLYYAGNGIKVDYYKVIEWYSKAVEHGNTETAETLEFAFSKVNAKCTLM